ncbi:hypothetical protein DEU56DRAFT_785560 [Suillus clintonianus]|uniref:uncharacterized protein n=1 Tax=Suillus clintonianus TaxID=1904413 RepID=UPI001B86780E|nr:uncharacterized protein DEU56DRAFT_785560 [Suillus clintonianus]KAG2146633.1 hypothetical protein DEU56DRAFT_785560 [Suillus clintonianus]
MAPTKSRDPQPVKVTSKPTTTKPAHRDPIQLGAQPKAEPKEPPNATGRHATKQTSSQQVYTKKIPHRSGKPMIINWFQRKLSATVKPSRIADNVSAPGTSHKAPNGNNGASASPSHSRSNSRSVSSPLPQIMPSSSQRQGAIGNGSRNGYTASQRKTISLNGEGDLDTGFIYSDDEDLDASTYRSSLARDSFWSPTSALEADEDASLRPLPPSSPPSPSLSHSSSSYLSNSRTFRSIAASTKPTTVLSVDLGPAGVGHIAQVPITPVSQANPRFSPHVRTSSTGTNSGLIGSGASVTFSALPPSLQSSSRPPSSLNFSSSTPVLLGPSPHVPGLQAPLYTAYHPRNNPRPSSPPMDNASVLTLASSAYAISGARLTMGSMGSTALSGLIGGGDSISHLEDSFTGDAEGDVMSQFVLGDDDRQDVDVERDVDASVRALRPRSSRRGSWESEVSGWSARILGAGGAISMGSKSLWTSNISTKTGGPLSMEDDEATGDLGTSLEEKTPSDGPDQADVLAPDVLAPEAPAARDGQHSTKEAVVEESSESVDDVPATLGRASGSTTIHKLPLAET